MTITKQPKSRTERDRTNRSLEEERGKTDAQLAKSKVTVEEDADAVVEQARERADGVLDRARVKADAALRSDGASQQVRDEVAHEREKDRAVLATERRVADAELTEERVSRQRAIVEVLQHERQETDTSVFEERVGADEAIQSRDDILAIVSHDLRGLVYGIGLSATVLQQHPRDETLPARVDREAARIRAMVAQMTLLLGDLVDAATIETGKLSIVARPADPRTLLAETASAFEGPANARGIVVEALPGNAPPLVSIDSGRILQVLANLVSNALKFTPRGGRVSLEVETVGDQLRFAVRDTGAGIEPEHLDAIFRQFWQVDRTDRRGVGLGLYISRWIVEAHGGKIWVESRVGHGTTFFVSLPLS